MFLFASKKRRELHELQLKSHKIKSLGVYMFMSYDIFHKTSKRYPSFDLSKLASVNEETISTSLDLIHSAIVQFTEVAALSDNRVKIVDRVALNKWIYLHAEEYEEAMAYITHIVTALAKKKEALAKATL